MHPPFVCSCCGQHIEWDSLRWEGTTEVPGGPEGPGYFLEQRSHVTPDCGTTLATQRELNDADARRDAEVTRQRIEARRAARAALGMAWAAVMP